MNENKDSILSLSDMDKILAENPEPTLVCACGHRGGFKMNKEYEFICPVCGNNLGS